MTPTQQRKSDAIYRKDDKKVVRKEKYMSNEAFTGYENMKFQTRGEYLEIITGRVYP